MSLTLPTTYSNSSKLGNIQENWIVQLGFFNGDAHGSGEGGLDATLQADGSANLINLLGSELVQDGDNPDHRLATWTMRDSAGNSDGWDSGAPSPYSDDEIASMINTLTGNAVDAGLHYSLTFTVGVATLSLTIGGGDLTGNTADEIFVAKGNYAVGTHTITFTATADRSHLWFTANTVSAGNGTIDDVILKRSGYSPTATSIIVDDGTVFQVGDYIKIESEIIKILSISTNTLTVARGAMGTTAAAHLDNTAIYWNNFTPISLADTTVDNVFYHGTITNKPSIRSSMSLAKSTAKTGNVSLSIANFNYKGDDFSAELFLGTRKYINREVRIYSQLSGDSTLANCLQVYSGRLIDISHDTDSIKLSITEQRPWDFISIPQDVSAKGNYFPVVYGDFAENASTYGSPAYTETLSKALHPVQVDSHSFYYYCLNHEDTGSTDKILHYYEPGLDAFTPLELSHDAESYSGGFALKTDWHLKRHFKFKPTNAIVKSFSSVDNMIDGTADETSANTGETLAMDETSSAASNILRKDNLFNLPSLDDMPDKQSTSDNHGFTIECRWRMDDIEGSTSNANGLTVNSIKIMDNGRYGGSTSNPDAITDGTVFTTAGTFNGSLTSGTQADIAEVTSIINSAVAYSTYGGYEDGLTIRFKRTVTSATDGAGGYTSNIEGDLIVYDLRLKVTLKIDKWNTTTDGSARVSSVKQLYSGHDGFAKSFAGGSGTASTGLEAHRDLLNRFAGWDAADSAIYNWDDDLDIEAARITSAWNIRWWEQEPVELNKILNRIQYEFGFIFKFRHDGSGSYWYIKNSYASGDVAQTLKKDDITNLQINNTPFSELLTKMEINYEKHPAESRYISNLTAADTTNNQRTTWNILAKENIANIDLDMNVNKPGNANPGGGDPNDGFADYYMNIFGDVKKVIGCDIINSAKAYSLETGDIVQFSNTAGEMPVDPFGDNWADYYMVTDLKRSPGKVSITAREVG